MTDFVSALKQEAENLQPNVSVTENGAIGYKTTGSALLDLNFMLSSMRNMSDDEIWYKFLAAHNENPKLAVLWMFFIRDVIEGCGERRTFRVIFKRLCYENDTIAIKLLHLIPEYGRWDDLIDVMFGVIPCNVRDKAYQLVHDQLIQDLYNAEHDKPVSLLGKWMPSTNASSRETRRRAEVMRNMFGMTPKQYRKSLAKLRKYIDVVEVKMSANRWRDINYSFVPSRASMNYREAFDRHDHDRYAKYLERVQSGDEKIHAGVLYPHDIVHAYHGSRIVNPTLEAQWKALPNKVPENGSTLVVVDGSGSMMARIGGTDIRCLDVAYALGIYFAEKLGEPYYNSFITFSSRPKFVHFADGLTLRAKLDIMESYDDCSNTDIEKTFNLILDTAVKNHLKQEELPANVLIISDMEYDQATYRGGWGWQSSERGYTDRALFDMIAERFAVHGYKLPRLVFWNVCSRTGTIPLTTNDLGVALVSGFSTNIADMVMSGELDPYKCLVSKLLSDRYEPVEDALKE